jgi:hypothetical protein
MENVSDDLSINLTEEELRELLDGLPDIIRELEAWAAAEGKLTQINCYN